MREALSRLAGIRVLVVGDLMVDRYQWGTAERISPEAPVPVVKVKREETRLGGAANVAHNLAAVGCPASVVGLVGADPAAEELKGLLTELGADLSGLVTDPGRPTTVKLRVMAHDQQLLRCDWEDTSPPDEKITQELRDALVAGLARCDGVIVSDYGKGLLTPALLGELIAAGRREGKPVLVDPKGRDYGRYRGATCLTPNEFEAATVIGRDLQDDGAILAAAQELRAELQTDHFCITRGPSGLLALADSGEHRLLPAQAREVYDVTGAGDTFISLFGALYIAGTPFFEAVETANMAAGIVVGKVGTATVTVPELLGHTGGRRKIYGADEAAALAESLRAEGRSIVFTNGCFDLLHAGHIQYLQASRDQGDLLIVGINSDDSVRRLKGPTRPLIGEEDRAHLLAALSAVDHVVIFEEDTPETLLRAIKPHVLTKGADYTVEGVVGHDFITQWGGRVALIPLKENRSTSGIIDKIVADHQT